MKHTFVLVLFSKCLTLLAIDALSIRAALFLLHDPKISQNTELTLVLLLFIPYGFFVGHWFLFRQSWDGRCGQIPTLHTIKGDPSEYNAVCSLHEDALKAREKAVSIGCLVLEISEARHGALLVH